MDGFIEQNIHNKLTVSTDLGTSYKKLMYFWSVGTININNAFMLPFTNWKITSHIVDNITHR